LDITIIRQGLKLGLINISSAGLMSTLPIYLSIKFIGTSFIVQLTKSVQKTLQQKGIEDAIIVKVMHTIQHMTPEFFVIGIFVNTVLLGFVCTLVISAFSKNSQKTTQQP
jgi:uncharacterized ion transporter superfamily protein YfcC